MIMAKDPDGTYRQVGFIKDNSGADIEYIKDKDGVILFEKGFTREKSGALPLQLDGIGKDLKDYTINGNIYQPKNVSPDTPQEVLGVGERTGNLFDFNSATFRNFSGSGIGSVDVKDNTVRYTLTESKNNYGFMIIEETEFSKGTYTISANIIDERTDKIDTFGFRVSINGVYDSFGKNYFTITDETALVKISFYMGSPNTGGGYVEISNIMLNTGSTSLPYEPYGYKVDMISRGKNLWKTFSSKVSSGVTIVHNGEKYLFSGTCNESINTSLGVELNEGTYSLQANANRIPVENTNSCIDVWIPSLNKLYNIKNEVATYNTISFSIDTPVECSLRIRLEKGVNYDGFELKPMLNLGSTATSYEPYTPPLTTPIYLDSPLYKIGDYSDSRGKTEEVRAVKELVLTGEENWSGTSRFRIGLSGQIGDIAPICTHYRGVTTASYGDLADGRVTVNGGIGLTLAIYDSVNQSSLTAWKSYLAAQYAAGTPIKVYYVLATPETKTVEPVEIPTLNGTTVIEAETTVQPSNMYVKYKSSK